MQHQAADGFPRPAADAGSEEARLVTRLSPTLQIRAGLGEDRRPENNRPTGLAASPFRTGNRGAANRSLLEHTAVPFQDAASHMLL